MGSMTVKMYQQIRVQSRLSFLSSSFLLPSYHSLRSFSSSRPFFFSVTFHASPYVHGKCVLTRRCIRNSVSCKEWPEGEFKNREEGKSRASACVL